MGDSYCIEMAEQGAIGVMSILAESKSGLVRVQVAHILHNMGKVESIREQLLEVCLCFDVSYVCLGVSQTGRRMEEIKLLRNKRASE